MPVNPDNLDLERVEDVTDIKPASTLAVSEHEHHVGPLGREGKTLLLRLLAETDEREPPGDRVFRRLGVDYEHTTWNEYDLFWADADDVVSALEEWNAAQSM